MKNLLGHLFAVTFHFSINSLDSFPRSVQSDPVQHRQYEQPSPNKVCDDEHAPLMATVQLDGAVRTKISAGVP
jgi:hypothetical protein